MNLLLVHLLGRLFIVSVSFGKPNFELNFSLEVQLLSEFFIMGNFIVAILWALVFIFISFFVGGFCIPWYVLLYTFQGCKCCSCLQEVCDLLRKGVEFPNYCSSRHVANF
ncbi:hypothetical protein Ocin01_11515 [Orchesella cincta]|uniref:Uncharacterized protein n=1 Tax=Orchesella cincta TaxID=48709 RepID=A0A1D2MQ24_ORCCI|nr:hypothetical protein Ocin01_11515 [Orchesella cincta]